MRGRLLFLVLAILAVAGFAALNWAQIMTPTRLNFGLFFMEAPLGAILLGLLGLTLLYFLAATGVQHSRMITTENRYTRELQAQRDLADKAEASRFTELRQYLDTHFREGRQRDSVASGDFEKSVLQSQRELRAQLEQMNHTLASRLADQDARLGSRTERVGGPVEVTTRPVDLPARDRVKL